MVFCGLQAQSLELILWWDLASRQLRQEKWLQTGKPVHMWTHPSPTRIHFFPHSPCRSYLVLLCTPESAGFCGRPALWWSFPCHSFPALKGCQDQVWKGFCQQQCWGIQSFTSLLHWLSSFLVIWMSGEQSTRKAIPDTDFTYNKNVKPESGLDAYSFSKYTSGHSSLLGF